MQEFIQSVVSQLGINQDQAKSATGDLLNFLKDQRQRRRCAGADRQTARAEALMQSFGSSGAGGVGGLLGGLAAGLGGNLGSAGGALAIFQSIGIDGGKIAPLVTKLIDYAKQKAGPELVGKVIASVPALKGLASKRPRWRVRPLEPPTF